VLRSQCRVSCVFRRNSPLGPRVMAHPRSEATKQPTRWSFLPLENHLPFNDLPIVSHDDEGLASKGPEGRGGCPSGVLGRCSASRSRIYPGGNLVAQPWSGDLPPAPGLERVRGCRGSRHFRAECGHFSEMPRPPRRLLAGDRHYHAHMITRPRGQRLGGYQT
jgi:hypothetical protein